MLSFRGESSTVSYKSEVCVRSHVQGAVIRTSIGAGLQPELQHVTRGRVKHRRPVGVLIGGLDIVPSKIGLLVIDHERIDFRFSASLVCRDIGEEV